MKPSVYHNVDVQDAAMTYNYSSKHINACYDYFQEHAEDAVMVDIAEALARHVRAQAEAEAILKQHGVSEDELLKVVYAICCGKA